MSFQNELTLNEARLKTAAKYLKKELTSITGESFGHAESLQLISQALFSKPFEEVKALMAQAAAPATSSAASFNPVIMYSYGSETYLLDGEDYVSMLAVGTDMEISYTALYQQAIALSRVRGFGEDDIKEIKLPEILPEDYEAEHLIELVKALGYTRYDRPLIEQLDGADHVLIDGHFTQYLMNGDWIDEAMNEDNPLESVVWLPECEEGNALYEYFFTLRDIGSAERVGDNEWLVNESGVQRRVKVF